MSQDRGLTLEILRLMAGFKSRKELGKKLGVNPSTIQGWETGKFFPQLDRAYAYSKALGISMDELVEKFGINDSSLPWVTAGDEHAIELERSECPPS